MSQRVFVVEHEPAIADLLRAHHHHVTWLASLDEAAALVAVEPPDLLVLEVRPAEFNGLPLLRRSQGRPRMTMVLTASHDRVVEAESRRHGASYLVKPADARSLVAIVREKLEAASRRRRWPRWPASRPLFAEVGGLEATVVDVSYEGLRVELLPGLADRLPARVDVAILPGGPTVPVRIAWMHPSPSQRVWCGLTLLDVSPAARHAWRALVDELAQ